MSHVTDILLCTAIEDGGHEQDEHPNADALSAWLADQYGEVNTLKRLDRVALGEKTMGSDVFGVAINDCNINDLVAKFKSIPWEHPESAQLMIRDEDWESFHVYEAQNATLRGGEAVSLESTVTQQEGPKTLEQLQAAVDEIRDVCRKHGVVLLGTCWSEGIYGEISISGNTRDAACWTNPEAVADNKVTEGPGDWFYLGGIGDFID